MAVIQMEKKDENLEKEYATICVNGNITQIETGEPVEVPQYIADIYKETRALERKCNKRNSKKFIFDYAKQE